jgi:transcriptional regulator with XRE-family HTH domain
MVDATAMGRMIREARLRKGMSLGQLAAAVGRSSSSVRRWERGEVPPAIGLVDQLAEVLDLDPAELRDARPEATGPSADADPAPETDEVRNVTAEQTPVPAVEPEEETDPAPVARAERGFLGDVVVAIRDLTSDWSGWIRGVATAVVLIVMLIILIWALGQLVDGLRQIWDSFDAGTTP